MTLTSGRIRPDRETTPPAAVASSGSVARTAAVPPSRPRRALTGELGPFAVVGLVNIGVNVALFDVLARWLGVPVLLASVIATILTTASSYLLNRSWAFSHRDASRVPFAFARFSAINLAGIALETVVLAFGLALLPGAGPLLRNLLKVLGICAGTVLRFLGYRAWVFRAAADRCPPGTARPGADVGSHSPDRPTNDEVKSEGRTHHVNSSDSSAFQRPVR